MTIISVWRYLLLFPCRITACVDIFCGVLRLSPCLRKGICYLNMNFEIGSCKNLEAVLIWHSHFTPSSLFFWRFCLNSLILNFANTLYFEAPGINPLARTSVHHTLYTSAFCHKGLNLYLFQMLLSTQNMYLQITLI